MNHLILLIEKIILFLVSDKMCDKSTQLELLPNEILNGIFQYFDAHDLFRAFFNLNFRFNRLLQSRTNLCFTVYTSNPDKIEHYENFAFYTTTLQLGCKPLINCNDFPNIRRMKFTYPTSQQLKELQTNNYPYLEYLSIHDAIDYLFLVEDMCDLSQKIFSNGFPRLKSLKFSVFSSNFTDSQIIQLPQLRYLTIGTIDFFVYQIILSVCPNLNFFQFAIYRPQKQSVSIQSYAKLKQMIIEIGPCVLATDDCTINNYLKCVPDLEKLVIHRKEQHTNIELFLNYHWFASSIDCYLPLLHQFKFYLYYICNAKSSVDNKESLLNRLQEDFRQIHNNRYKSKLNLKLFMII